MLSPERDSVCNNLLKDDETCLDVGKSNMSSFCSLTEEQKQVSHVMEVFVVVAIKLSALGIHMLLPQMKKLLQDLLVKFVDQKVLKNLENVNAIMEYDVNNADNYNVQRDMGTKTCSLLTKVVKDNLVKKKFVEAVTNFYTASTAYLIRNLPLGKQVLIDAQYLHSNCRRKNVEKPLLRLVGEVTECLGGSWHDVFQVEKSCTVDDLKDMIKTEISFYRMETIPESFYLCEQETKSTQRQQTCCWY